MEFIDVLGKPCPIPVIEARKMLEKMESGGVVLLVDNLISVQNLEKMANGLNCEFEYAKQAENVYKVMITLGEENNILRNKETQDVICSQNSGLLITISSNEMGRGDEVLGNILIKGFIYSITELNVPPEYLIFFNAGVKLSTKGSNAISDLKKLEERGTKILSCGTCLNYYQLENSLEVGTIANMYTIVEKMNEAKKIINI